MNTNDNDNREKKKKKEQVNIREMTIDDLAPVFHLGEKLFTPESSPNLYRTWDEYEVVDAFRDNAEFCLAAESEEEEIIGFILGTTIEKRRSSWKYGYLIWLGVDGKYQDKGVASRLFNHFRNLMIDEGVRMLLVDTEANNLSAIGFFEKMGFEKPKKHVYLSLNLDSERQSGKE